MLREMFPFGGFSPPATEVKIADVERQLGMKLPEQLRQLYLECDGFREDRGNAKYLLSLTDKDDIGSLVGTTQFWWTEWKGRLPKLDQFIFFGFSCGDRCWGINPQHPDEIIAYHHHMEDEYEVVGQKIIEVYSEDYARYGETE